MSSYQDIAQSFLFAQAVLIEAGKQLVRYAGECESAKMSSNPSAVPMALANYNRGLGRLRDALDEYKASFQDLSAYVKPK